MALPAVGGTHRTRHATVTPDHQDMPEIAFVSVCLPRPGQWSQRWLPDELDFSGLTGLDVFRYLQVVKLNVAGTTCASARKQTPFPTDKRQCGVRFYGHTQYPAAVRVQTTGNICRQYRRLMSIELIYGQAVVACDRTRQPGSQ